MSSVAWFRLLPVNEVLCGFICLFSIGVKKVRSKKMSIAVSTVSSTSPSSAQAFGQHQGASFMPGSSSAASLSEVQGAPADNRSSRRGLLGVFGRGFFAKPINHSEEENYRYLMALDR